MINFDEYIQQGEPGRKEKAQAWQTAIGLQDVDGLKVSSYLIESARKHIEGEMSIDEVRRDLKEYYETKSAHDDQSAEQEEADCVSSNIVKLLNEKTFSFSLAGLMAIHRRVFEGVFKFAGQLRTVNITKKEWILEGDTVRYVSADEIRQTIEYDLSQEKQVDYTQLSMEAVILQLAKFTSGIWQIHPFREGNTRTTAVFVIKYLRSMGFNVTNDLFAEKSWYFRNALVRANYQNIPKGIAYDNSFLVLFFRNLILGEQNELHNRDMHISKIGLKSARVEVPKSKICTLNYTLEESAVLRCIEDNPKITQKDIATAIGKSERTVKNITSCLVEKGILIRVNGRRNGWWQIKCGQ
ncbi:Fic family protein [Bacteroides salyersiae]|jgi:fic protein|uniref:Fic family protein n=1 Tax=Bacteroides salyersiae TaxID=291644 RepID=UPI000326E901|nr:Fic family protein [Bacteroides salyersiae]EOA51754.1 hypothetical protein HMPREF1532_00597 [Bacteroides salyersiae WAL 10018 = DSM 18765 = JCM 12988]MCS3059475.1 Fic family protein [Bacteroides salyersiae]